MKRTALSVFFAVAAGLQCFAADGPVKEAPKFKALITCFNGKIDSGSSCAGTNYQPDGTTHLSGKMKCGHAGQVSEIEWTFVKRSDGKDVYKFTRKFPADGAAPATTSKDVEFSDSRVVIFEDKVQVIVIDPPKK